MSSVPGLAYHHHHHYYQLPPCCFLFALVSSSSGCGSPLNIAPVSFPFASVRRPASTASARICRCRVLFFPQLSFALWRFGEVVHTWRSVSWGFGPIECLDGLKQLSQDEKPSCLPIIYWFNRDPYFMVYCNAHITG